MRCKDCRRLLIFWDLCHSCELDRYYRWGDAIGAEEERLMEAFEAVIRRARERGAGPDDPDVRAELDAIHGAFDGLKDDVAFRARMKGWRA